MFGNIGDVNFNNSIFNNKGGIKFDNVDFKNSIKDVNFNSTKFQNTIKPIGRDGNNILLSGDVSFLDAKFNVRGDVLFKNANFGTKNLNIIFDGSMFCNNGKVSFHRSGFNNTGIISFNNVKFNNGNDISFARIKYLDNIKSIFFTNSIFRNKGNVFYDNSLFKNSKDIRFDGIKIHDTKKISFKKVDFSNTGNVIFYNIEFKKSNLDINFNSIKLSELTNLKIYSPNINININNVKISINNISRSNCKTNIMIEDCELSIFKFDNINWDCINFKGTDWGNGNRIILIDEKELGNNPTKYQLIRVEDKYREWKEITKKSGNMYLSDKFHASEFEMRRRLKKRNTFLGITWEGIYKRMSGYGMKIFRPICMALIFMFMVMIICFITSLIDDNIFSIKIINLNNKGYDIVLKNKVLDKLYYSFYLPLSNLFFVNNELININNEFIPILLRIQQIITAPLLFLAGFAIRRKFRT